MIMDSEKAALIERIRTISDRHPDPAARDRKFRLHASGIELPRVSRPYDIPRDLWDSLTPAEQVREVAVRDMGGVSPHRAATGE